MPGEGESREYKQEQRFAAHWSKTASGFSVKMPGPFYRNASGEVANGVRILQHAIDIAPKHISAHWAAAEQSEMGVRSRR